METVTYTKIRANLGNTIDRVCNNREPLIITRNRKQSVVMLPLKDYKSLMETAYLLSTPANAKRLLSAAAQVNVGYSTERKLNK